MWTADIDINERLVAGLVAAQFPEFSNAVVAPLGFGWDNAAFLIGGRVVFRFPRRRIVANLIEREIKVLPQIASRLPLAISAPRFIGTAAAEYPWAFAGYEMIGGSTACSIALSNESRAALAEPLAEFLRALHGIDPTPLVALGLIADQIGRLDHEKHLKATRERLSALDAHGGCTQKFDIFANWLETHPTIPLEDHKRRLVHGDLYARHVLLNSSNHPTGIIDWGDAHLGDPAIDISIAHLLLPSSAHGAFRNAYGPIDDRTWAVARYRAIYHAILELDYGIREDDAGMREIGSAALRLMRPAILNDLL